MPGGAESCFTQNCRSSRARSPLPRPLQPDDHPRFVDPSRSDAPHLYADHVCQWLWARHRPCGVRRRNDVEKRGA